MREAISKGEVDDARLTLLRAKLVPCDAVIVFLDNTSAMISYALDCFAPRCSPILSYTALHLVLFYNRHRRGPGET